VSYLPVITLRQKADPTKEISTTDPGRALVTGKWADIGKFKGPILRGLSARAPYFHNGAAAGLKEVIEFYNVRFDMGLTEREKADLVAFLSTL
jgi:cytochrome c peroxidase